MNLMWWEHEQLIDHMNSRPSIWQMHREGMWLRTRSYNDDTACLGLAILPPKKSGPFRQYTLNPIPFDWDDAVCKEYLENLCKKWTDYGTRKRYIEFLTIEGGIDLAKASALAIGLCAVEQGEFVDPEGEPLPSNRALWPDVQDLGILTRDSVRTVRTFGVTGGGWVSVRLAGGMLRVRMSLRDSGKYGGGYGGTLDGFVRPTDGNVPVAAAYLFGNDTEIAPRTEEEQLKLKEYLNGVDGQPSEQGDFVSDEARRYLAPSHLVDDVPTERGSAVLPSESSDSGRRAEDLPQPEPRSAVPELPS